MYQKSDIVEVIVLSENDVKKPMSIIFIIATMIVAIFGVVIAAKTPEFAVLGVIIIICEIAIVVLTVIYFWIQPANQTAELDYMSKVEEIRTYRNDDDMARVCCDGYFRINGGKRLICQMEFTPIYVDFMIGGKTARMRRDKIKTFYLKTAHELVLIIDGLGEYSFLCNDVKAINLAIHLLKMYAQ